MATINFHNMYKKDKERNNEDSLEKYGYKKKKQENKTIDFHQKYLKENGYEYTTQGQRNKAIRAAKKRSGQVDFEELSASRNEAYQQAIELAKTRGNKPLAGDNRTTAIRSPKMQQQGNALTMNPLAVGNTAATGADIDYTEINKKATENGKGWKGFGNSKESTVTPEESEKHALEVTSKYTSDKNLDNLLKAYTEAKRMEGVYNQVGQSNPDFIRKNMQSENNAKRDFMAATGVSDEEFERIVENYTWLKNKKEAEDNAEDIKGYSKAGKVGLAAATSVMAPITNVMSFVGALDKPKDEQLGRNYNSDLFTLANTNQAAKEAVHDDIEKIQNPVAKTLARFGFDAGVMGVESASSAMLGEAGLATFFTGGYSSGLQNAESRGLTEGQSQAYALATGGLEYITERIPWEGIRNIWSGNIAKESVKGSLMPYIKALLKQSGEEAGEEIINGIGETLADAFISGDKSNLNLSIQKYMSDDGLSEQEATRKAVWDVIKDTAQAAVTAALSAGASVGPALATQAATATREGRNIAKAENKTGAFTRDVNSTMYIPDMREGYIADQDYSQAQETRQAIRNASEKTAKGERIKGKEARALYESAAETYDNLSQAEKVKNIANIESKKEQTENRLNENNEQDYKLPEKSKEDIISDIEFASTPYELTKAMEYIDEETDELKELVDFKKDELKMYGFTDEQIDNAITPKKAYEMGQKGEVVSEEQLKAIPEHDRQEVLEQNNQQYNKAVLKEHPDAVVDKTTGKYFAPSEVKTDGQQVIVVDSEGKEHTDFTNPRIKAAENAYTIVSKDANTGYNTDQNIYNVTVEQAALATDVAIKSVDATPAQIRTAVGSIFTAGSLGTTTWNQFEKRYNYIFDVIDKDTAKNLFNSVRNAARVSDRVKQKNTAGQRTSNETVSKTLRENLPGETVALLEAFGKKIGYNFVASTNKDARGDILPSKRQISIGSNNLSEVYAIASHEGIAEFLQAHGNEEEVLEIQDLMLNYLEDKMGTAEYQNLIDTYQSVYRTGAKSEIDKNKSRRAAANEMFADTTWTLFSSEEGLNDFTKWVTENNTAAEQVSIFQKIKDFFGQIYDAIKSYIESGSFNGAEKAALEMDAKQAKELRDKIFKAMDHAIENARASEGVQQEESAPRKSKININGEIYTVVDNGNAVEGENDEKYDVIRLSNQALTDVVGDKTGAAKYKEISKYILSELSEDVFVMSDGLNVKVDRRDASHIANNAGDKKRAEIAIIKELIKKTKAYAEDVNVEHNKFDYFRYYIAFVNFNSDIFPIFLNVGRAKNDGTYHLYDITQRINTADRINGLGRLNGEYRPLSGVLSNNIVSPDENIATTEEGRKSIKIENPSNGYSNLTQFIGISNIQESLNFYLETAELMHDQGRITDEEYKALQEQGRERRKTIIKKDSRFSKKVGDIEQQAIEHFGTTDSFRVAGYMLTDGTLLDFSGAHWLEGASEAEKEQFRQDNGMRQVDHEDIYEVMEASGDNRKQFMDRGNIRLNPEAPGFNVSSKAEPTPEQYRQLKEFIREVKKNPDYDASRFYVDIEDTHPNKISYENNLNEDRIINDLKKYYATGEMPQQFSLNDFRYSKKVTLPDGREVKYLADVLNPPEYNRLKKMIDSGYPAFNSSEGDAVYRLDNKLVYARGKENFGISRIVEANVNDDSDATYILDWFADQEEKGATYEQQRIIAEDIFREGSVNQYTNEMFGYVSRYDRPTKRGKSRSDAYYAQREQNRRRVFIKDEQLVDDDIRKSIKVDWDNNYIYKLPDRTYDDDIFFLGTDEEIEAAEKQEVTAKAYVANIIHSENFAGLMFKDSIGLDRLLTRSTRKEWDWQLTESRNGEPIGHENYKEVNDDITSYDTWPDKTMAALYNEIINELPKTDAVIRVIREGIAEDARQSIKVYGEASPYADSINETKTIQALIGSMNNSLSKADVFEVPNDELIRIEHYINNKYKVSGMEEGEIAANVAYAFAYMQKNKLDTDYETMMNYLLNIGDEVIKNSNLKDPDSEQIYNDTRAKLASHRIKLTDADRAEISNAFGGSWKAAFGALQKAGIKLDNKNGVDIDSIFSEIKQEVLEAAGVDISYGDKPSEQILALIDTMTALEPTAYLWDGANDLDKALSVVTDIVEQYYSAATEQLEKNVVKGTTKGKETLKKAVEKEKARLRGEWSKYKNDKTQEFNEIVAEKNRLIQQQQNEIKKQNELMKTWEKDMAAKDKELSKRSTLTDKQIKATARLQAKEAVQSYKDRQERAKQIENIKKTGIRLIKWLTNPTDAQHVPPFLQRPLGEFLAAIDFLPNNPKADAKSTLSWHQRMNTLREELVRIKNAEEDGDDQVRAYFANNIIAKELISMMDDFLGKEEWDEYTQSYVLTKRGASKVSNLDAKDLATLNKIMSALSASINNLNKTYANDQFKEISKLARESVKEVDNLPARKDMQKMVGKLFNFLNFDELEPITWFEGLGSGAKSVFQELRDGFNLKTKHVRESDEYMAAAKEELGISDKELSTWKNQLHKFELYEGTVLLNTTQIMSLYEILKRKQGRPHVAVGGIKAADFEYKDGKVMKKHHQAQAVHIMSSEAQAIINTLTDEQKALADKMQQYMASECASWGNRVTEKMWGYKKYEEEDYFPLKTDAHSRATTASSDNNVSYYTIKNASFTKPITPMANNAVVLEDIFDVFTDHVVSMADYDAYVMPIADAMRWFNYSERVINATEPDELNEQGARMDYLGNMQESIDRVYGDAGLQYFRQFIKDINGDYAGRGGKSEILSSLMSMYKAQAVGANMRVVIQQPTAVVRAADVIETKYLLEAMASLPMAMKYAKKAQANSEIAYWKAQGYYETYLGQSFKEIITGDTTIKDRINDWSGKLAGLADDLSWGIMYHAAELKVKATYPELKEGTAAFDAAATKLFEDIVDHTQVVDTIFHKSQWMRSQELGHKMTSAFMAEPTKTYNMLYRAYRTAKLSGDKKIAMRKLKDVALIFVFEQILNAIVTAVWDSLRDDEKEDYLSGVKAHFKENAVDNLNLLKLLPLAKDIFSFFEGYDATSYVYDGMESLVETILADKKYLSKAYAKYKNPDDKDIIQSKTPYGIIYQNAKAVSQMSGIPVANVMRDAKSIYNAVNGFWGGKDIVTSTDTQKKISKARETNRVSEIFDAGDLSAIKSEVQQAYENGVANSKDQSESAGWTAARNMLKEQFQRQIAEHPENKAAIVNRYKTLLKYTKRSDGKGGYRALTDKEIENTYINWLDAAE